MRRLVFAAVIAAVGAAAATWAADLRAAPTKSPVVDLRKPTKLWGRTPEQWTVEWWQWIYSIPAPTNPGFDTTGEAAAVGQRGPVWFLCGAYNSTAVDRTVTVPEGVALFFPITNIQMDSIGTAEPLTLAQMQDVVDDFMAAIDPESISVTLDDVPVGNPARGRVAADVFTYWLPEDNVPASLALAAPRGIYSPAISDGYWVMVRPLPAGRHTLRFAASAGPPFSFTLDIRYTIDVVPVVTR